MIRFVTFLYFLTGSVNIASHLLDMPDLNWFTKPFLMPLLLFLLYLLADKNVTLPRLMLGGAVIFSWIGDMLLLRESEELFFLGGLGSFLVAQVLFSITLYRSVYTKMVPEIKPLIPIMLYGGLLLLALMRKAGPMSVPVLIYALCILTMVSIARLRRGLTLEESYRDAFIGAFLFVISDSILALNRFVFEIPYASVSVMITYISAQYFLVKGVMNHRG